MDDRALYGQILQLGDDWRVGEVKLDLPNGMVELTVVYVPADAECPECGERRHFHDHAPQRRWRHLDTCQLQTIIACEAPRTNCTSCGVLTVPVPWAEARGRFTRLFEAMVIHWLLVAGNQSAVARQLGISLDQTHRIMEAAVERGLARRESYPIEHLGIDEKSMRKGHAYFTVLSDLKNGNVLDICEDRTQLGAAALLQSALDSSQRKAVKAVAMDMWRPYMQAVQAELPQADIVHDRYHVSAHLNHAVDLTRRAEQKKLSGAAAKPLKNSRFLWLRGFSALTTAQFKRFHEAGKIAVRTAACWQRKETFVAFWEQPTAAHARQYFDNWLADARAAAIPALTKVADMLARHLPGLVNYATHHITNALSEAINAKIQLLKATARGFRSFRHYRINILFHFADLDLSH